MPTDVTVVGQGRYPADERHDYLAAIVKDPKYHGQLMTLLVYSLPEEKGKALQAKHNMAATYGNTPDILGFTFVVTRSVDNTTEYLGVIYNPAAKVAGVYEEWHAAQKVKAEEAKRRRALREGRA